MIYTMTPRVYSGMNMAKLALTAFIVLTSFVLNITWFKQITKGLIKAIFGDKKDGKTATKEEVSKKVENQSNKNENKKKQEKANNKTQTKAIAVSPVASTENNNKNNNKNNTATPKNNTAPVSTPVASSKKNNKSKKANTRPANQGKTPQQQQQQQQEAQTAQNKKTNTVVYAEAGEGWSVVGLKKRKTKTEDDY